MMGNGVLQGAGRQGPVGNGVRDKMTSAMWSFVWEKAGGYCGREQKF